MKVYNKPIILHFLRVAPKDIKRDSLISLVAPQHKSLKGN